jgi:hypothetical protein
MLKTAFDRTEFSVTIDIDETMLGESYIIELRIIPSAYTNVEKKNIGYFRRHS